MTTRQVNRAEARHAAKLASSEARGFKYPESKYVPHIIGGKTYATNGKHEVARRVSRIQA